MNVRKIIVPVLSMTALVLGGCAQAVDYATFHEKAVEAAEVEHEYTAATVSYEADGKNTTCELKYDVVLQVGSAQSKAWTYESGDQETAVMAITFINTIQARYIDEDEHFEYYTTFGNGFRVIGTEEGNEFLYEFESHGLLVLASGNDKVGVIAYR